MTSCDVKQHDAKFPKATLHRIPSDARHFPLPRKFTGFQKGHTVYVKRSTLQCGFVRDVYALPNGKRVYLVLAASAGVPDFRLGIQPLMETLTEEDLCPPCVSWTSIHPSAKYECARQFSVSLSR